jgi:hypothetical protein
MAIPPQTHLDFLNTIVNAYVDDPDHTAATPNGRIEALKSHRLAYIFGQQQLDDLAFTYRNVITSDQWNKKIDGLIKQVPAPGKSTSISILFSISLH